MAQQIPLFEQKFIFTQHNFVVKIVMFPELKQNPRQLFYLESLFIQFSDKFGMFPEVRKIEKLIY